MHCTSCPAGARPGRARRPRSPQARSLTSSGLAGRDTPRPRLPASRSRGQGSNECAGAAGSDRPRCKLPPDDPAPFGRPRACLGVPVTIRAGQGVGILRGERSGPANSAPAPELWLDSSEEALEHLGLWKQASIVAAYARAHRNEDKTRRALTGHPEQPCALRRHSVEAPAPCNAPGAGFLLGGALATRAALASWQSVVYRQVGRYRAGSCGRIAAAVARGQQSGFVQRSCCGGWVVQGSMQRGRKKGEEGWQPQGG